MVGSTTSQMMASVVCAKNGSITAVSQSGTSSHVGFVDRLPSGDGGAVEHRAVGQEVLIDQRQIEGDVLPLAARIGEAQIDELDLLVLDQLEMYGVFVVSHDWVIPFE